MGLCAELNCNDQEGEHPRAVRDPLTGREYYIKLCEGHADEFDSYHKGKGGGSSDRSRP